MTTMIDFDKSPWRSLDLIAFDTETTGKYPLSAEVCELAAVKWRGGEIVDVFHTLLKPSRPMGDEVIAIHGITNEMVEGAPKMLEKIGEFREFISGAVLMAHHAPFDLGFMALEMENHGIELPEEPVLCTSLLSRRIFPESGNHRLQTLIGFFGLEQGTAHRALDDARACLAVGLRCLEKAGEGTLEKAFVAQGGAIHWSRFSMHAIETREPIANLARAVRENRPVAMAYGAGSRPGAVRRVHPEGIVRSLDGDFLSACEEKDRRSKRYYLDKITSVEIV